MRKITDWLWWQWFKWRTRDKIDWRPLTEAENRRTRELAERLGWDSPAAGSRRTEED
jgi:hypothetical protein